MNRIYSLLKNYQVKKTIDRICITINIDSINLGFKEGYKIYKN